jgi:predicted esterase
MGPMPSSTQKSRIGIAAMLVLSLGTGVRVSYAKKSTKSAHVGQATAKKASKKTAKAGAKKTAARASHESSASAKGDAERLDVPGQAPAYFVAPSGKGKKPVVVWVHARSGNPQADCVKWGAIVRPHAWLLCPSGPEDRGGGARGWNNSWTAGKATVDAAFSEFRKEHGKKLASKGHALIGFSEGAYVAMNVGVREPETFSRWLILAASDGYWGVDGFSEMRKNKKKLSRVYLLTGEKDGVVDNTRKVFDAMDAEKVNVRLWTPDDIGHEVPGDRMRMFYRKPVRWLFGLDKK